MSRFIQLHLLTSYPPSNLNRDDLGRPKTALVGGKNRLRISSQSLKRAWRTSDIFQQALKGHIGTRTKTKGKEIYSTLKKKDINEKNAMEWSRDIAVKFGSLKVKDAKKKMQKKEDMLTIEQLVHFSPEEERDINELVKRISDEKRKPTEEELSLLRKKHKAVDIALFGRMLASKPKYNMEAAVQVSHAISVQSVTVEDDFFTAVDDLNTGDEDRGAGHLGDTEFASGLFYLYICIDKDRLVENLTEDSDEDSGLVQKTLKSLIECAATISPTGKQNSFASRSRASYIRCETGNQQPRSLSVAFLSAVDNEKDMLDSSIKRIEEEANRMNNAYGECADNVSIMNVYSGEGRLEDIIQCATEA